MSEELSERFSKRHAQIDEAAQRLLTEKPELASSDLMAMRRLLATAERERKQRDLSRDELRTLWESQLTPDERQFFSQLPNQSIQRTVSENRASLAEAVEWAEEHLFDRNSVVFECQIWQEALGRVRGQNFPVSELKDFASRRGYIRDTARPGNVTLREVLLREWEIVQTAKNGVGACWPLVSNPRLVDPKLDDDQRRALEALFASTDSVSVFRGGAGTGKSYVLHDLVEQLRYSGRDVTVLAPQRQQIVEMEKTGFPSPITVTNFLLKRELKENAVLVVDEAGQIGGRQMLELLRLARERNVRVILSGDTRQHGAVEASDALLAIERHSGVKPIELHKIRRQDPALGRDDDERKQIKRYRKAVESAAAGKLAESFDRLDKMGAIVSCGLGGQTEKLADEYLRFMEQNASAVIVSQTWAEIHRVNLRVRYSLKAKGLLGANDSAIQVLERLDLTNAQKRDERFYPQDAVVLFNQKVRQIEPGARGKLAGALKSSVLVEVGGRIITVSNKCLDRISVCQSRDLQITDGDRLHLKANRRLSSGRRVTNGELVTVKTIRPDGGVELTDGRVLDNSFREFLPGYAVTSYGSQGKTN